MHCVNNFQRYNALNQRVVKKLDCFNFIKGVKHAKLAPIFKTKTKEPEKPVSEYLHGRDAIEVQLYRFPAPIKFKAGDKLIKPRKSITDKPWPSS